MKTTKRMMIAAGVAVLLTGVGGCVQQNQDMQTTTEEQVRQTTVASGAETATIEVDGMTMTWIADVSHPQPLSIFPDADKALTDSLGLKESVPSSISVFVVERNGKRLLFDTGLGHGQGRLAALLDLLEIKPADIDYLFLTHLHGDHIGGMTDMEGRAVFAEAEVYLSRSEYDGWMEMPEEKNAQAVATLKAYDGRLHLFEFGDILPGGVLAVNAVGHTPGHTVYQVGQILIVGDIIHGAALQMEHPEICATYDMDKEQAIASRRRILDYVKQNGLAMAGMHLPSPAFVLPESNRDSGAETAGH